MSEHDMSVCEKNVTDDDINRWVTWCSTRRIFAPCVKSNVLARLQPRRGSQSDRDSFLDPEMPFLNMAIHELCERDELAQEAECFLGVYWYCVNIKTLAYKQQCARSTVYIRARRFAVRARSLSKSIRRTVEEKCSEKTRQNCCSMDTTLRPKIEP